MFSPDGYTSLYDLAEDYRRAEFSNQDFVRQCAQVQSVAVCTTAMQVAQVSTDLLHRISWEGREEFAFIDMRRWVVSLHRIREAAKGMKPELFVGARILLTTDPHNFSEYTFPPEFVTGLEAFEGQQIVVRDTEADKLKLALTGKSRRATLKRFPTKADTKQAFSAWIGSNPLSTDQQRNQWYTDHGLSREAGRKLWSELKPQGGSKAGPKPKD